MNAKKAKALRKLMKNLQKVHPDRLTNQHDFIEDKNKQTSLKITDFDEGGNLITEQVVISQGQLTVDPASARGLYLQLKKSMNSL